MAREYSRFGQAEVHQKVETVQIDAGAQIGIFTFFPQRSQDQQGGTIAKYCIERNCGKDGEQRNRRAISW